MMNLWFAPQQRELDALQLVAPDRHVRRGSPEETFADVVCQAKVLLMDREIWLAETVLVR